jgi:hypothetical protein
MWLLQIPWGGASALRPQEVRRSGLLDAWKISMAEDAPIKSALSQLGLRLQFVPSLMVLSAGPITLRDAVNFLKRQLLWTRLYHPSWPASFTSACLITLYMLLPWLFAAWAWLAGYPQHAAVFLAMALAYWCLEAGMIALQDGAIRHVIVGNGQQMPRMSWALKLRIFLAIPLSHLLHVAVMISAALARSICWSGIEYRIVGKQVRMVRYEPAVVDR